ncbi:MAG: hypothetical protein LUG84_00765 [Akkermansiaceae bacterium]|nr:hypothetical protein [Akkermansiaceae bacterium]MCD8071200.1 hypothetical protein [Akkermansiaceae bacterium]
MKILHLIIVLLVLCISAAGLYYSLEQQKQYELIVQLHGGGAQIDDNDAQGLRKEEQSLTAAQDVLAKNRSKAIADAKASKMLMRDMRDQRNETDRQLTEANKELDTQQKRYEAIQRELKKIVDTINASIEQVRAAESFLSLDPDASLPDLVNSIKEQVNQLVDRNKELQAAKEDLAVRLTGARDKVAREETELSNLKRQLAENRSLIRENEDEYVIAAVDNKWNFVILNIGRDSSLSVGESNQLLVKRNGTSIARLRLVSVDGGQAVADFDPQQLKQGQRIEVGDHAIRIKPFGD